MVCLLNMFHLNLFQFLTSSYHISFLIYFIINSMIKDKSTGYYTSCTQFL